MFESLKRNFKRVVMFIACCLFIAVHAAAESTQITSTFDHASIGPVRIIGDTLIKGQTMHWIKQDKVGNQYYWFYVKLSNVKNKTITFELDNMTGVYRGNLQEKFNEYTQPVYSYDKSNWSRITNTSYDRNKKQFRFVQEFSQNHVWIAYAHPYPQSRHHAYIDELKQNKDIVVEKIGESVLGKDITMITLPQHDKTVKSKNVLILACQHAGEDCGGFFVEGLIWELLSSDSEQIQEIRENATFYVVPMMNPDGYYFGTSRYNYNMQDLNAEWDDDVSDTTNLPVEPEVQAVKTWYNNFKQAKQMNLVVDVHSHGQEPRKCTLHSEDEKLSILTDEISTYWPAFFVLKESQGNCRGFFVNVEKIPACTLELSQSDLNDGRPYLTIEDYHKHGGQFVHAIHRFLKEIDESMP